MVQQTALKNTILLLVTIPAIIMVQLDMDVSPIAVTFRIQPFSTTLNLFQLPWHYPSFSTHLAIMTEGQSHGYTQSPTSRHGVFFFGGNCANQNAQKSVHMVCFQNYPWKRSFFQQLVKLPGISNLQEA